MVIMNLLRMLVDVSFYCAFAGLIARACGGSGAFTGAIIQCICFGLSYFGRERKVLRLAILLPMVFSWVIHCGSVADCILLVPTAVYIIWLVWKNDYLLEHERQRQLFGVFWKAFLVVILGGMLLGGTRALAAITVPYAVIVLICSVLLMRSLRHEPEVYCQKRYQIANFSVIALVAVAAGLLSSKSFLNACAATIKAIYTTLVQPIMEFILNVIMYLVGAIAWLFSWISLKRPDPEQQEQELMDLSGAENLFGEDIQLKEPGELLRVLGFILLATAAVVLLVLFFRWMNRRYGNGKAQVGTEYVRENDVEESRAGKKREASPVRKVRALYRGFLKWCVGKGVHIARSSTSLDIHRQVTEQKEISAQIRELYLKARYAQDADHDGVRLMKQLCNQIKKFDADA